jgi:hypothetical protein
MSKKELQQKIEELHNLDNNQIYSFGYRAKYEEIVRLEKEIMYLEDREKNEKNALLQKRDPIAKKPVY